MNLLKKVHEILGPLSQDDLDRLRLSIERDGVLSPVTVRKATGDIIDGAHRASLAEEFPTIELDVDEKEAARQAVTLNLARRHLTQEQKKELVDLLRSADFTQEEVGEMVGLARSRVSELGNISNVGTDNTYIPLKDQRYKVSSRDREDIVEQNKEGQTQQQIAADFGISQARVSQIVSKQEKKEQKPKSVSMASKNPRLVVARAEEMPQVEDESVDLIITSPPYNLGKEEMPMGGDGRTPREDGIGYDQHKDNLPEDEYQSWQLECLNEMFRVAKDGASLFYNHKVKIKDGKAIHPMEWLGDVEDDGNPWTLRQEIVWDRGSTHNHSAVLFWPHDERIYWMTKGKPTLPERSIGMSTVWQFHGPVANTWHPAPFCEGLPKLCLEAVGRDGIVVLDPFAGSCTTLKIALEYGYDAVGVDVSREYLDRAAEENGWIKANKN